MAYFKRGKCYMMMHDYKRALYDFSAAILNETRSYNKQQGFTQIKQEGGNAQFYMHGGQCNYYLGQYEEALAHYEIAKNKTSDNQLAGLICYNKGLADASLMKYQNAIDDQEEAISLLDPSKVYQAKFQLGVTQRRIANSMPEEVKSQDSKTDG